MSLEISLTPTLSNTFHRLKTYMDYYVYDCNSTAIPSFEELTIDGSGANVGEVISITRNDDLVLRVTATSGGTFSVVVPALYKQSNTYRASGPSSGFSNLIVFDIYNWLLMHYLFSIEFLSILEGLGQSKQDLYIDSKVGDSYTTTGDPAYFETEVSTYETSKQALVDKMTLPIPSDYWGQNIKEAVKQAIEISEKGPVQQSLQLLKACYAGVNLSKIFTFQWDFPVYWNLDTGHIPHVLGPSDRDKLVIPSYKKVRLGSAFRYVTMGEKQITFTGVSSGAYYWIYVDGEKDIDDTLKVKVSQTQPIPGVYSKTLTFNEGEVSTDDDEGTVTGIAYQKYVVLSPPVASISCTVSISDDTGDITNAYFVSREILALGRANTTGVLSVTYDYWMSCNILCVLQFGGSDIIEDMMRIWAFPGHVRSCDGMRAEDLQIYIKFSSGMVESVQTGVLNNLRDIIMEMVPIVIGFVPYVNIARDDQEIILEDSIDWSGIWKGYRWLEAYIGPSKIESYFKKLYSSP